MRVVFTPPTEGEFKQLFAIEPLRKGGGLEDISIYQPPLGLRRGGGILSFISGVAKRIFPFLLRSAKPAVREFGSAVAADMIANKRPFKKSVKKHGLKALKKTGLRLLKGSGGVSKKRKSVKKRKKRKIALERYKTDVYDLL